MEVILAKDVASLGKAGELVKVKDGYAKNFLFPRGLAKPATQGNRRVAVEQKAAQDRAIALTKAKAEAIGAQIVATQCQFQLLPGQNGKVHGSVTARDIVDALKAQQIEISKHQVQLDRPIAELTSRTVPIKLHPEVVAELKVSITAKT